MSTVITAGTATNGGASISSDTAGSIQIQTGSTPTTAITIDGSQNVTVNNVIPSGSTAPTNGMFLPTTNTIGFSTASTERMRIDSSGNLFVGGTTQNTATAPVYSSTTAKAWVNFGASSINASYNVSSITFNSNDVVINFTNAFVDTKYATVAMCESSSTSLRVFEYNNGTKSTTQIQLQCVYQNGGVATWAGGSVIIFR